MVKNKLIRNLIAGSLCGIIVLSSMAATTAQSKSNYRPTQTPAATAPTVTFIPEPLPTAVPDRLPEYLPDPSMPAVDREKEAEQWAAMNKPFFKTGTYKFYVFGKYVTTAKTFNKNNVSMIPIKDIAKALGYKYKYNARTKTAELSNDNQWFTLTVGRNRYNLNRATLKLETAPVLNNNVLYVPASYLPRVLSYNIEANSRTRKINVFPQPVPLTDSIELY